MALLPGSLTVIQAPLINQWLICIQLRHIFSGASFLGSGVLKSVISRFSSNDRDTFPLLIKELSDSMNLAHCNHTPFLLKCLGVCETPDPHKYEILFVTK